MAESGEHPAESGSEAAEPGSESTGAAPEAETVSALRAELRERIATMARVSGLLADAQAAPKALKPAVDPTRIPVTPEVWPTGIIVGPSATDARDYDFSAQILKKLGAIRIRLLSNNPEKVRQLEKSGIRVVERVPCQPRVSKISRAYLKTKKRKMGHLLEGV